MLYSFLVQSARLSNSLRFLFLLDNLCYSCTCPAPPRLAFQLFVGQTIELLYFCAKNKVVVVVFAWQFFAGFYLSSFRDFDRRIWKRALNFAIQAFST